MFNYSKFNPTPHELYLQTFIQYATIQKLTNINFQKQYKKKPFLLFNWPLSTF